MRRYGDESHQLFGKEEPLGLRMVLDGVTVVMPTLYDPCAAGECQHPRSSELS